MQTDPLQKIIEEFEIVGTPQHIAPFGSGHINDTYKVEMTAPHAAFILQRINHHVFPDVDALMSNMVLVTRHIAQRNEANRLSGQSHFPFVLRFIPTKSGQYYVRDAKNNRWRLMPFIPNAVSYDQVETIQQAVEGGRAFGKFHSLLGDLDPQSIQEVIPHFHHIGHRLEQLKRAIASDPCQRLADVQDEIRFIQEKSSVMMGVLQKADQGLIPKRILHNDTKFNNILFDQHGEALCVIDLDTVMPGYLAYDFGDAIRSIINTAAEDAPDLDQIGLNIPLFRAYSTGYFSEMGSKLTDEEIDSLMDGVRLLPYMQAVRFLTDYLLGDAYFKIQHPHHNLQRTRAQLRLVRELGSAEKELRCILVEQKNLSRIR